jgi:hypothetical protein
MLLIIQPLTASQESFLDLVNIISWVTLEQICVGISCTSLFLRNETKIITQAWLLKNVFVEKYKILMLEVDPAVRATPQRHCLVTSSAASHFQSKHH